MSMENVIHRFEPFFHLSRIEGYGWNFGDFVSGSDFGGDRISVGLASRCRCCKYGGHVQETFCHGGHGERY